VYSSTSVSEKYVLTAIFGLDVLVLENCLLTIDSNMRDILFKVLTLGPEIPIHLLLAQNNSTKRKL